MAFCSNCGFETTEQTNFCPSCGTQAFVASASQNLVGSVLGGKYQVLSEIGAGSMGTVFLAEHIRLKKRVALKVLHADLQVNEESLQRLQREGIAAGKFSHPSAIQIFDFDKAEENGVFYLAMEFVDGKTLGQRIRDEGPLSVDETVELGYQLLSVLAEAHEQGIIHRDLKPENLMVSESAGGEHPLKVLDFGLSKLVHIPSQMAMQTQTGRILGTPLYMSPEQCGGGAVDHRSDLYAVGLILYESLAGHPPFGGENIGEILYKHTTQPPPSLVEACAGKKLPEDLVRIIERSLEKNPDDRFSSATDMLQSLRSLRRDVFAAPSAQATQALDSAAVPGKARSRTAPLVVGGLLVAGIVVAIGLMMGFRTTPEAVPKETASSADTPLEITAVRVTEIPDELRTPIQQQYAERIAQARRSLNAKDFERALQAVGDALAHPCADSEAYLIRGLVFRELGDREPAQLDLQDALDRDPEYGEALAAIGWLEFDRGDWHAALGHFEKTVERVPESVSGWAGKGAALFHLGRSQARESVDRALELSPRHAVAQNYLGWLLLDEGDAAAAQTAFIESKRSDPQSWHPYAGHGQAYEMQGENDKAEIQFREALKRRPDARETRVRLCALLTEQGQWETVDPLLAEGIQRHPDEGRFHVLSGIADYSRDQRADATKHLEDALERDPFDDATRVLLGIFHQQDGNLSGAIDCYEYALERMFDGPPSVALNEGICMIELERYEDAQFLFQTALQEDPKNEFALLCLGILHMTYLGDPAQAAVSFREYQAVGGTDERVNGWLRELRQ